MIKILKKDFKISIIGDSSCVTIKTNNNCAILFYMNSLGNRKSVYEYYIYIPTYNSKNYIINKSKTNVGFDKLNDIFPIKTKKNIFLKLKICQKDTNISP